MRFFASVMVAATLADQPRVSALIALCRPSLHRNHQRRGRAKAAHMSLRSAFGRELTAEEAAFVARQADVPPVTLADLTVHVSEDECRGGELTEATLNAVVAGMEAHGVVKLAGAWPADPTLVAPVVESLRDIFEDLASSLAARGVAVERDSFGFKEVGCAQRRHGDSFLGRALSQRRSSLI